MRVLFCINKHTHTRTHTCKHFTCVYVCMSEALLASYRKQENRTFELVFWFLDRHECEMCWSEVMHKKFTRIFTIASHCIALHHISSHRAPAHETMYGKSDVISFRLLTRSLSHSFSLLFILFFFRLPSCV